MLRSDPGFELLPPALGSLSRLQICCVEHMGIDAAGGVAYAPPLPSVPWLQSLRWLRVGIGTLLSSMAVLQAATVLECASSPRLAGVPSIDWTSTAAGAMSDWLAHHPSLRRMAIDAYEEEVDAFASTDCLVWFLRLCRRRPGLLVHCPGFGDEGESLQQFLETSHPF